jgi:hypothetical protein
MMSTEPDHAVLHEEGQTRTLILSRKIDRNEHYSFFLAKPNHLNNVQKFI